MENYPDTVKDHREHMWARDDGTVGLTYFGMSGFEGITYVKINDVGTTVEAGEEMGLAESNKASEPLIAPISGTIAEINEEAVEDIEPIEEDPYGAGWLARIDMSNPSELDSLLSADEYRELVEGEEDK